MTQELIERLGLHQTWRDSHGELNDAPNEARTALQSQSARIAEYRDIFAEITAKARPECADHNDPERITNYSIPVGPIHRAAGRLGFQMFDGEAHLRNAVARIAEQDAMLREVRPYIEAFRLKEAGAALMGETDRMPIRRLCKRIDNSLTKDSTSG